MKKQQELIEEDELEEWEEGGFKKPFWVTIEERRREQNRREANDLDKDPVAEQTGETAGEDDLEQTDAYDAEHDTSHLGFDPIPIEEVLNRRTVYDLEESFNAYGRTIYVEQWDETTGKPKIWYEFNKQKILVKSVRGPSSITSTYLGKTKYI